MLAVRAPTPRSNAPRSSSIAPMRSNRLSVAVKQPKLARRGFADEVPPEKRQLNINANRVTPDLQKQIKLPDVEPRQDQQVTPAKDEKPNAIVQYTKPIFTTTVKALDTAFVLLRPGLKAARKGVDLVADVAEKAENKTKDKLYALSKKYPKLGNMFFAGAEYSYGTHPTPRSEITPYHNPLADGTTKDGKRLAKDYFYQRADYLDKASAERESNTIRKPGKIIDWDHRNLANTPPVELFVPFNTWVHVDLQTNHLDPSSGMESRQPYFSNAKYIERVIEVDASEAHKYKGIVLPPSGSPSSAQPEKH